jgi:hypothetical protein
MDTVHDCSIHLDLSPCPHRHLTTVLRGSWRLVDGEPWDDIQEKLLCLDCFEYLTEKEVRARWDGREFASGIDSAEETDYGDY